MRRWLLVFAGVLVSTAGYSFGVGASDENAGGIPLRLVVTDLKGRPVSGLSAADVEIYDGGRRQTLQTFAAPRGPRTFGILLDEYHVAEAAAPGAVQSLLAFVDRLRPDDTVFVMRPLDSASLLAPVAGRGELRTLISKFNGRSGNYTPQNAFEAEYLSSAPPTATRQRAQVVRAAMQALATAMNRTDPATPRAMIVITEGFQPDDRGRERLATLRTVARAARAGNIAVYVLDPSVQRPQTSSLGEQWESLVTQTGGLLTIGEPIAPALDKVFSDLDSSYLVTIGKPEREDGSFHRLEVRLKRKDVAVRAPSGYWAPIAAERLTPPTRPAMSTYLKTPHISGLIQPWFRMTRAGDGRTRVTFSWMSKSGRPAGAHVALSAVTFDGKRLIEADVAAQGAPGAVTRGVFETVPGPIQVSMAISNAAGKLLDTEVRYIDVPALDKSGAMIAAVELVRTRTLRQFLQRQLEPDVMPADTREFDRHDRIIVRVHAFAGKDQVPIVSARLLNSRGQAMKELPALPAVEGIPQFDLPLASYARGDYRIEIRATTDSATSAQLVPFRLVG
jgi:VWFA-related protein